MTQRGPLCPSARAGRARRSDPHPHPGPTGVRLVDAYLARLREAVVRDVVVNVAWTGQADIDIAVEEPAGTICSSSEPRTLAGGVALGDSYAAEGAKSGVASETYVCPQGFAGTYRVRINRVWGEVAAGKIVVT